MITLSPPFNTQTGNWELPDTFNFATDIVDYWAAQGNGDKIALITVDQHMVEHVYTYSEISRQAAQYANLLEAQGLKQGDRVIVMLPRIAEWQIAMTAVLRAGAVPIPCITMLTEADLAYRAAHAEAVAVITLAEETAKFDAIDGVPIRLCTGDAPSGWTSLNDAAHQSDAHAAAQVGIEDAAILYYTSGSTGKPKGVTHAARALYAWASSAIHWLELTPQSRIWCTADTGWSKAGTSILFGPWSQGASVLFYDGPFEPQMRLQLLQKYQISCYCAAATELRRLILEDVSAYDLSHLKTTVSAGESVNPEIIHRWQDLTGITIRDGYGQTETLMTVTNRPGMAIKPGSMGVALPGVDIAVRTDNNRCMTHDAAGELLIKLPNPQVMTGYRDDEERTKSAQISFDGGRYLTTGDTVEIDAEGYVFYTGRVDDLINSSGYRIGPQEVENVLSAHEAVQECAVVGAPDAERGELVKAYIILNKGFSGDDTLISELQRHVKAQTAPYKYPRAIVFVGELPKTVSGKIQRNLLRQLG